MIVGKCPSKRSRILEQAARVADAHANWLRREANLMGEEQKVEREAYRDRQHSAELIARRIRAMKADT